MATMEEFATFFEIENAWQKKLDDAADAARAWMDEVLADEGLEPWANMRYPQFKQALANANAPAFPYPESDCEEGLLTMAATQAAWDYLQRRCENENA